MKLQRLLIILLLLPLFSRAQKPPVNYGLPDSTSYSIAYKILHDKYDYAIAYTTEGYWESDRIHYDVIAFKNGTYFKGSVFSKRHKAYNWPMPSPG
jgi:hypothetical protein